MGFRILLIIALVLFLAQPVHALERLNSSDFKEPDIYVAINNVEEKPVLKNGKFIIDKVVEKGYAMNLTYKIEPIDDETRKTAQSSHSKSNMFQRRYGRTKVMKTVQTHTK